MPPTARKHPSVRPTDPDPVALLRAHGMHLTRRGRALEGECPLHADAGRSLYVNPQSGHWNCRACHAAGLSVVELVERVEVRAPESPVRKLVASVQQTMNPLLTPELQRYARSVMDHYRSSLEHDAEAQQHLLALGLGHPELLATFPIGYADGTLPEALADGRTHTGRQVLRALVACGVLTERGGRYAERLRGHIVFGIENSDGVLVQLLGRLPQTDHARELLLPVSDGCLFHPLGLSAATVIVCASIVEALSLWVAGVRHVVCVLGDAVPPELAAALQSGSVRRVLFAPGTERLRAELEAPA